MKNNLKKNFFYNSVGSIIYSFTSLFYMIISTRVLGIDKAGIFTFAFSTANILQVLGIYAGRTYQVTEINEKISDSDYYYNRIFSCIFMVIIGFMFCLYKDYTSTKFLVIIFLILYKMLDAFAEHYYAIIQKNNYLYKVGISLILKGIIGVLIFLIISLLTKNIIYSCLGLIITNFVITFLYDHNNARNVNQFISEFNLSKIKLIYISGFWIFMQTFLIQYIFNISKYSIDRYLTDSYQTIYGIILMPATFLLLVSQFIIQPYLIMIKDYIKDEEYNNLNKLLFKLCIFIFAFGLICIIFANFIGVQILEFIYSINLNKYVLELIIVLISSILFSISYIFNNVLIALRKTFAPAICYIIVAIIGKLIADFLVLEYSILGAVIDYFIAMLLIFIIYLFIYIIEIKKLMFNKNNNK